MDLAQRLQELRRRSGHSQEQVAELLGVSRQAVSKWESGQGKPELDNIIRLSEVYHVSADYLLTGREGRAAVPPSKREMSRTTRRTIGAIAIIASTAVITLLFITALAMLAKYGLS